jgi:hypothetical protein
MGGKVGETVCFHKDVVHDVDDVSIIYTFVSHMCMDFRILKC